MSQNELHAAAPHRHRGWSTLFVRPVDELPCNRDLRTAIIITFALSSAATSIYNHNIRTLAVDDDDSKEKGANGNNSRVRVTMLNNRGKGVRRTSADERPQEERLHQSHIVRWFYNQRGLVTGSFQNRGNGWERNCANRHRN